MVQPYWFIVISLSKKLHLLIKRVIMPAKFSYQNKNQKLLRLYCLLLFSGQEYSLISLVERLNCSKQTVLRYLDDLDMSAKGKIERRTGEDRKLYVQMKQIPLRPKVSLEPEQIQHLLMCHDLLSHLLPKNLTEEISNIIGQTTVLLEDFEDREKALRSLFFAKPAGGKISYNFHEKILDTLKQAITETRICNISYESSLKNAPIRLSVAPIKLITYKNGLYLKVRKIKWKDKGLVYPSIGRITGSFTPTTEDIDILAVHRIKNVELSATNFTAEPETTDERDDIFGMLLEKPFQVTIAFSPLVAGYIRQRTWSKEQIIEEQNDGGIHLTITAGNKDEVFSWILSFGLQAQIIKPQGLRARMRAHSRELARVYEEEHSDAAGIFETSKYWFTE